MVRQLFVSTGWANRHVSAVGSQTDFARPNTASAPDERQQMVVWIDAQLARRDCTGARDPGRVTMRRLNRNEFKRRQMPPGIKLSQRAFGSGRRMPMAARFGSMRDE